MFKRFFFLATLNMALLAMLFADSTAMAQQTPGVFNFSARIIKPNGQPLQNSSVAFRFTLTDVNYTPPASPCVMYIEDFTGVDWRNDYLFRHNCCECRSRCESNSTIKC